MPRPLFAILACGFLLGSTVSVADDPAADAEKAVREAVTAFNAAYERNDLDTYFSYYADDASLIINSDRLTRAAYETEWREFVASGAAVNQNSLSDIQVTASPAGDAVVARYLLDVLTRQPDGSVAHEPGRETDVWFLTDAGWRIVHLHYSYQPAEDASP